MQNQVALSLQLRSCSAKGTDDDCLFVLFFQKRKTQ